MKGRERGAELLGKLRKDILGFLRGKPLIKRAAKLRPVSWQPWPSSQRHLQRPAPVVLRDQRPDGRLKEISLLWSHGGYSLPSPNRDKQQPGCRYTGEYTLFPMVSPARREERCAYPGEIVGSGVGDGHIRRKSRL